MYVAPLACYLRHHALDSRRTDPIGGASTRPGAHPAKSAQTVTAVTGIHITFEPDEIQVTAPSPQYGLKSGDTVFGYMNLGEGFFNAWFNGYWVEDIDGSGVDGLGC